MITVQVIPSKKKENVLYIRKPDFITNIINDNNKKKKIVR